MLIYREKDKAKLMVLIPSVLGVLLYFVFVAMPMMARMRQATTPSTTPVQFASASTTSSTASNTATNTASDTDSVPPEPNTPAAVPVSPLLSAVNPPVDIMNDPFKPPASASAAGTSAGIGAAANPANRAVPPAQLGIVPAGASPTRDPGGVVIGPAVSSPIVPAAAAPVAEITLQGVVLAEHAVGVFHIGDQTFYKRIGDVVSGNIVLRLVSDNGVVLQKGKQLFTLEIGHSDLSPTTKLAPPESSTMTKSSALIDKAAEAYRATETTAISGPATKATDKATEKEKKRASKKTRSSLPIELNTQPPLKLKLLSAQTVFPASAHSRELNRPIASNLRATNPIVRPAVSATAEMIDQPATDTLAGPDRDDSTPADGLSSNSSPAPKTLHKRTKAHQRRRRVRHIRRARRHPIR